MVLSLFLAPVLMGYSPLMWIGPEELDSPSIRFEVKVEAREEGGQDYKVRITRKTRDFRAGVSVGICAAYLSETAEGFHWARRLPYVPKGRVITTHFHVTAEELEDPELAFWITDPVFGEGKDGKLKRMPAQDSYFLWLREFPPENE